MAGQLREYIDGRSEQKKVTLEIYTMPFCLLLWLTTRGAAAGDEYDVSVFTHLSGLDAKSSCSVVSFTRTADCYSLAACEDHTESGDHWCHTKELLASNPKDKNLECTLQQPEQVMYSICQGGCTLHGIHLSNSTFFKARPLKRYPYFAFAFSSSKQRLYFCTHITSHNIISTDVDGANEKTHVKRIACESLAVDDINSFVFFVGRVKPIKMTSRVKDNGYEIVKNMASYPVYIAVHPGTKTLFVSCFDKILSFDYNGKYFKQLLKDMGIFSLAVNPSGETLYYGKGKKLISVHLKTLIKFDMPITFPKGWSGARYMVYANNRLIVSCTGNPYIIIFDHKTKENKTKRILEATFSVPLFISRANQTARHGCI